MAGEDQERFEDYVELDRYIAALQTGRVAHPPTDVTPDQARIYRMAALFRSGSPEAAEPRPAFVEKLRADLLSAEEQNISLEQGGAEEDTQKLPILSKQEVQLPPSSPMRAKRATFVSRRSLLTSGAVAAASLAAGVGIGTHAPQQEVTVPGTDYSHTPLVGDVPTTWHFVTTVAQLGTNAVRFVTDTVIGYVMRDDSDSNNPDKIIAMSAACTHMGCIVQWHSADRSFHCPCHGGMFSEYGAPINSVAKLRYLSPLPQLKTSVIDGKVYVEVPAKA